MSAGTTDLVLLMIGTAGAWVSALFAILCFLATKQASDVLTTQGAAQILRAETDIVRAALEDQARGLRQELGHSLTSFQELSAAIHQPRDRLEGQVVRPGRIERLLTQAHQVVHKAGTHSRCRVVATALLCCVFVQSVFAWRSARYSETGVTPVSSRCSRARVQAT